MGFYVQNTRLFPCLVESDDLTALPASAIWILGVNSRLNVVIACPTARHIVIDPEIVNYFNFPLSRCQKGISYQSIFKLKTQINTISLDDEFDIICHITVIPASGRIRKLA